MAASEQEPDDAEGGVHVDGDGLWNGRSPPDDGQVGTVSKDPASTPPGLAGGVHVDGDGLRNGRSPAPGLEGGVHVDGDGLKLGFHPDSQLIATIREVVMRITFREDIVQQKLF